MTKWEVQRSIYTVTAVVLFFVFTAKGYQYANFSACPQVKGGAMNTTMAKNSSCAYFQCGVNQSVVDIPVALLEDYKSYSKFVLVTEDGCTAEEHPKYDACAEKRKAKQKNTTFTFVRLTVPYNDCKTRVERVNADLRYSNSPYISYIGQKWRLIFVNISCVVKGAAINWTTPFVSTTATTDAPTTTLQTPCQKNPCLNNGTCDIVGNDFRCLCLPGYNGPYCGEYLLPPSGVYEVTTEMKIDLGPLIAHKRTRRGANSFIQTAVFEVTRFGTMHAFRLLTGCPSVKSCYGWLSLDEYGRLGISDAKTGPRLLQMFPKNGSYLLGFDLGKKYISHSRSAGFFLGGSTSQAVVIQLQKLKNPEVVFSQPPYAIKMLLYEFVSPPPGSARPSLAISFDTKTCQPRTEDITICVWYTEYRGPKSIGILPLIFHNVTALEKLRINQKGLVDVKPVRIGPDKIKIVLIDNLYKMVGETGPFVTPVIGYRHHMCLLNDRITIDGIPFAIRFHSDFPGYKIANFVTTGTFLGRIDGLDVWCGNKTNNFLFRESTIFPECGGARGDLSSMQNGDAKRTISVKKFVTSTLETTCKYCPEHWVLYHGSCYHIEQDSVAAPVGTHFSNPNGGVCKSEESLRPSPWPAMVVSNNENKMMTRYADAVFGQKFPGVWIGMHLNFLRVWKWSHDGSTVQMTYWGPGEPSLRGVSNACVAYKSSQRNTHAWTPMPVQTDVTIGSASLRNFYWGTDKCSDRRPFVCQQPSTSLFPGKTIMFRIFIIGGSKVAQAALAGFRETLVSLVTATAVEATSPISYELIRIRNFPVMDVKTNDRDIVIKSLMNWKPYPGESYLENAIRFINAFSVDEKYRYVNIITSAYTQTTSSPVAKKMGVTTFALGVLLATEDHLKKLTSYPSCYGFSKNSTAERKVVSRRFLECLQGLYVADEMPYLLAGRSFNFVVDSDSGSILTSAASTKAHSTNIPTTVVASTDQSSVTTTLQSTAVPSSVQFTTVPSTVQSSAVTITVQSTAAPSTVQSTAVPSTVQSTAVPSTVQSTAAPSAVQSTAASSTVQSTAAPSSVRSTAVLSTVQSTAVSSTVQSSAPSTVISTAASSTVQSTAAPSTVQSTSVPSTFQSTAVPSTVQSTAVPSTVQSTVVPSTVLSTTPQSTGQSSAVTTIVQFTTESSSVPSTAVPSTVQSTAFLSTVQSTGMPSTVQSTAASTASLSAIQSTAPSTVISTAVPSTAQSTAVPSTVIPTTVPSTVHSTAPSTTLSTPVPSTGQSTVLPSTVQLTASSIVPSTAVPSTELSTAPPTTVRSTASSTIQSTAASSTVLLTVPSTAQSSTAPSVVQSNVPSTVRSTAVSTIPSTAGASTVQSTVPSTIQSTVLSTSTTAASTVRSTASTIQSTTLSTVPSTAAASTVQSTVPSSAQSTVAPSTAQSTSAPRTIQSTAVPSTAQSTGPSTIRSTAAQSTAPSSARSTVISTAISSAVYTYSTAVWSTVHSTSVPSTTKSTFVSATLQSTTVGGSTQNTVAQSTAQQFASSQNCPSGFEGLGCSIRTMPRTGVVLATASVDLSGLFPQSSARRRRSTQTSFALQLIVASSHYAVRSLHTCPDGNFCMWWLNLKNIQSNQVIFVTPEKGYHLWDLIPLLAANTYHMKSASNGLYVIKTGNGFFLSNDSSSAVSFVFDNVPGNSANFIQEKDVVTYVAENFSPQGSVPKTLTLLSHGNGTVCQNNTVCFQIQASNASAISFPQLECYQGSLKTEFNFSFTTIPKNRWYHVCIVVERSGTDVFIENFAKPVATASSKCCTKLILSLSTQQGEFWGYVKRINVWSRVLSVAEKQHVRTATCDSLKGDIQSSDEMIKGTGLVYSKDLTPSSVCRYCKSTWALVGNVCLKIAEKTITSLQYLIEDQCAKQVEAASHIGIIDSDQLNSGVSDLIESGLSKDSVKWPFVPYFYMNTGYQWITYGMKRYFSNKTYFVDNPVAPSFGAQCVKYRATNVTLLENWTPEMAEPIFMWDASPCSNPESFICKMTAGVVDPNRKIQVTIVMPNSLPLSTTEKLEFLSVLVDMLDVVVGDSASFVFISSSETNRVGANPASKTFLQTWKQSPALTPVTSTLGNITSNLSLFPENVTHFIVVVLQQDTNFTTRIESALKDNGTVFILGLQNTSLTNLQALASNPRYAAVVKANMNMEMKDKIISKFQAYLQGIIVSSPPLTTTTAMANETTATPSPVTKTETTATPSPVTKSETTVAPSLVTTAAANNTSCLKTKCSNKGTCTPVGQNDYQCNCSKDYVGRNCEFESAKVICGESGLTVLVSIDIIRSLSGTSNTSTPTNVILYFENNKNISSCAVTQPTTSANGTVYKLSVPSPFSICGMTIEKSFASRNITVSGIVVYERVTQFTFVDTSVVVANFTCSYKTRYGIGLRSDDKLIAKFQPKPNSLFSGKILKTGVFSVLLELYLDEKHSIKLSSNPHVKVGSYLFASLYSKTPLPWTMSLKIETCYLSANEDQNVKTMIVEIIQDNCATVNGLTKKVTSIEKDKVSFMFQVFQWRGKKGQMYLHCEASICDKTNGTNCTTNCGRVISRRRRDVGKGRFSEQKATSVASINVIENRNNNATGSSLEDFMKSERNFLVTERKLYPYLLAGLLMFSFLFFSSAIVIILHCLRLPDPQKFALHSQCSYQRGRSLSGSLPRAWTVVHALSPPHSAEIIEPKRRRMYAVNEENNNRVTETISPASRFSTFLGEENQEISNPNESQSKQPIMATTPM